MPSQPAKAIKTFELNINDIQVYAFHGCFEEERVLGQWYSIDVDLLINYSPNKAFKLSDSIDYAQVNNIVRNVMAIPQDLIEQVALSIQSELLFQFKNILELGVRVVKIDPPVNGVAETSVYFHYVRS